MSKTTSRILSVSALLVLLLMLAFVSLSPARAEAEPSPGCTFFNSVGVVSGSALSATDTFYGGETIYLDVDVMIAAPYTAGAAGAGYSASAAILNINGVEVARIMGDGTLSYTFPGDGTYTWEMYTSPLTPATWGHRCTSSRVTDPFYQSAMPGQGVHLDEARGVPYNGVLPYDVFEPHWWGVKGLNSTNFPKLADVDMSTLQVLCLDANGNWTNEFVTEWKVSEGELQVFIKQHGICGIFPK